MGKPSGAAKRKQDTAAKAPAKPVAAPAKAAKAKAPVPEPAVEEAPLPKSSARREVLAEPWQGWPAVERFGLYFYVAESDAFVCYHKFAACYAARKFVEAAAGGTELKLLPNGDLAAGRYIVRSPNTQRFGDAAKASASMQELYEHRYTKDEAAWVLPIPYDGLAANLAGVKLPMQQRMEARMVEAGQDPTVEAVRRAEGGKAAAAGPKVARGPREAAGDPLAIKADMPWDQQVRRMAKKLCSDANGGDLALWRTFKPAAEKRLKEAGK